MIYTYDVPANYNIYWWITNIRFWFYKVCKGPQQHEEASLGLLYIILVEPAAAAKVLN